MPALYTSSMKNMIQHPLRDTLTAEDWKRIQQVIDREHDNATTEELEAAHDVFYDAIAGEKQTHLGSYMLQ